GVILLRIFLVADADECRFEEAHDGRQDLLARQAGQGQVLLDPPAEARQGPGEGDHAVVLRLVADLAPARVVAVLLAAAVVAPGRLEVAVGDGADPHVGPGRRDDQGADALQRFGVADRFTVGADVAEAPAGADSADARPGVADVAQPGRPRSGGRIRRRLGTTSAFRP